MSLNTVLRSRSSLGVQEIIPNPPLIRPSRWQTMRTIKEIWTELENYYIANYPQGLEECDGTTDDEEIDAVETELGYKLPAALRESLKIHNGSENDFHYRGFSLSCCQCIVQNYTEFKNLYEEGAFDQVGEVEGNPGVQPVWWDYGWIPFANDCGGNQYCVDLNPADGGVHGQVITVWQDEGSRPIVARGYHEFLNGVLNNILAGNITIRFAEGYTFLANEEYDYDDELANK